MPVDQDRNVGALRSEVVIPRYQLAPAAYTTTEWYDAEQRSLFGPRWALVSSVDEIRDTGDFVTTTIGGAPLVVIRDGLGELRAFHNMCRHRGMELLTGCGTAPGSISCFYHHWRYGLDGALELVPQRKDQFPDLDVREWGLLPASVDVWEGMVFAHPDPGAPALADALAGVADHIGSHRPGMLSQRAHVRMPARCNWKLFVENHVDVYHLWYLHEQTLGGLDHTKFEWIQTGGNWASYEPARATHQSSSLTAGTDEIAHLSDRDRCGVGAHMVFPNLLMAASAEFFATYECQPVAPDRSVIDLRIRTEAGADIERVTKSVQSFIDEDIRACEAIQRAVASPAFRIGPLARTHELPIEHFHHRILEVMR